MGTLNAEQSALLERGALVTKYTQILERGDGSEVKIVAQAYFGAGLHMSVGVDVFRRERGEAQWVLCSSAPHPDWRQMSVDEYVRRGRSEVLRTVTHGEIFKASSMIGKPTSSVPQREADECAAQAPERMRP